MNRNMRKRNFPRPALFLFGFLLPVLLPNVLCLAQEPAKKEEKPQTAAQKYKNIKVLKDLPAKDLGPLMHQFNDALGVKCDACHVINPDHTGWEKDDKPMKDAARGMITMLKEMNKKQKALGGKGTCFMCHHGQAEPQMQPAAEAEKK